ncbi:hypothetical protein ABK040_010125 [Willaertia magna]
MELIKVGNNNEKNQPLLESISSIRDLNKIKLIKYSKNSIYFLTCKNQLFRLNVINNLSILKEIDTTEIGKIKLMDCDFNDLIINNENKLFKIDYKVLFIGILPSYDIKFIKSNYFDYYLITKTNLLVTCQKYDSSTSLYTNEEQLTINVKDFKVGRGHLIILDDLGDIYGRGNNEYGQLGIPLTYCSNLMKIELPFKVIQIKCFAYGTLILSDENELYCCGNNAFGCFGLDYSQFQINIFTKIVMEEKIKSIHLILSDCYTVLLSENNNLYISGHNIKFRFGKVRGCKKHVDAYSHLKQYYLDRFTKLDYFKTKRSFILPILLQNNLFFITSDKIIPEELQEEENLLGVYCFHKINVGKLVDIKFIF